MVRLKVENLEARVRVEPAKELPSFAWKRLVGGPAEGDESLVAGQTLCENDKQTDGPGPIGLSIVEECI